MKLTKLLLEYGFGARARTIIYAVTCTLSTGHRKRLLEEEKNRRAIKRYHPQSTTTTTTTKTPVNKAADIGFHLPSMLLQKLHKHFLLFLYLVNCDFEWSVG